MQIDGTNVVTSGKTLRVCRLQDEYYEFISEPQAFLRKLKAARAGDIFTFIQEVPDREPRFNFRQEWDSAAVLPLTTFEHWWKKQINDKTRNMIRKTQKTGVEIRPVTFDDELVRGIHVIYNESPVRQGRPFKHFGKDLETIRKDHGTFLDRSEFFGAFHSGCLIGFIKLVHGRGIASLMNIISMIGHRDKAPTNGLLSKAVEVCTGRGIPYLQYGTGNSRTIGDFKKHHAFEEMLVPRYFVPLTAKGTVALRLSFHRRWDERLPEGWRNQLLSWRAKWVNTRAARKNSVGAVAQSAEQARASVKDGSSTLSCSTNSERK
jgi:hypothetical protein